MSAKRKVVVVIHGIGDQTAFETVQSVIHQFCKCFDQPATVSLGRLDSDIRSAAGALIMVPPADPHVPINVAFTEIHWADVAREIEAKGYRLEDARHWARTIIERMTLNYKNEAPLAPKDIPLVKLVLQEIINAISVSELLMTVFKHAGAYRPKLHNVLTNYLGDVQLVTEFRAVRETILAQFDRAMDAVYKCDTNAELYILAHSEGTVVSFLGLLKNMQGNAPAWLKNVRGYITLGSPIDKHLVLWPELWRDFKFGQNGVEMPILWHNYYDLGDPIGFRLDTARAWLESKGCTKFYFPPENDFGFTRSYFPGKAHVDYWSDKTLFKHIIKHVINQEEPVSSKQRPAPPEVPSCLTAMLFSGLPYLFSLITLIAGVHLLYDAINVSMGYGETAKEVVTNSALIALHLAGVTVLSRVAMLSRRPLDKLGAAAFYLATTALFLTSLPDDVKENLTRSVSGVAGDNPTTALGFLSLAMAAFGIFSRRYSLSPLLFPYFAFITVVVSCILFSDKPSSSTGPVITSGIAFFCLWWLSATIFDLSFVWRAYIRNNRAVEALQQTFQKGADGKAPPGKEKEPTPCIGVTG